ncbi:MAG TPA: hypothetical protein VN905_08345, partial [Candidatus Binatia bacterium]|nr:hypothetical protein [Candidatus Binatia bacterium]
MSIRHAAILLTAVLCCGAAAAAADAPAGPKVQLRFVSPSITAQNWPHFIAAAQGFYDREGLQVEMTAIDPTTLLAALIGGSAEIALAPA